MSERFTVAGGASEELLRQLGGLERVCVLGREFVSESSLEVLLQRVADEARVLVDAAFSAVLVPAARSNTITL